MSISRVVKVAQTGLDAQRARMELIASNLANAQTTRTADGGPYTRKLPVVGATAVERKSFHDELEGAVKGTSVLRVEDDPRPPVMRWQPGHPDANAEGYVAYPNIDPAEEMVDLISAMRTYEANVNVVKTARQMNETALTIGR